MARRRLFGLLILAAAGAAAAQHPPAAKPAEALVGSTFRAFIVSDQRIDAKAARNRTGKMHCLVTENGLNPVVAAFSRTTPDKADAPLAKLAKQMNALALEYKADRLGAFVQFLTLAKEYPDDDKRDARAKEVRDLADQLKLEKVPFGLAAGKSAATAAFGLKDDVDLTVIFYHRMKVLNTWTFTVEKPPTDDDVKAIQAAVAAELKVKK